MLLYRCSVRVRDLTTPLESLAPPPPGGLDSDGGERAGDGELAGGGRGGDRYRERRDAGLQRH